MEPVRHIDLLSNFLTCSESCRLWRDVAGCDLTFIEKNICNLRAVIWLLLVGRGSPGGGGHCGDRYFTSLFQFKRELAH